MRMNRLSPALAFLLILFLTTASAPSARADDISRDYWFVTSDDGTGEARLFAPLGAEVTFMDGHGTVLATQTLARGELRITKLVDLGYPQDTIFCLRVESDRLVSCWLTQAFRKSKSQLPYPSPYNTFVYTSGVAEGTPADDVFWLYSETAQQVDFLDEGMNVIFSRSVPAGEIATVDVDLELGITTIPYAVILVGQAPFVATFHDSPDYLGGMQVYNR